MGGKGHGERLSIGRELRALARPEKAAFLPKFFKAFDGGYGQGDRFLGVVVPDTRAVARRHREASQETIESLLDSAFHEERMCGLLIMIHQFERGDESEQESLVRLYLSKLDRVNNWDLVDISAPKILGAWLVGRESDILDELLASKHLWRERVAMLSTFALIRRGEFAETLRIADVLLHHEHDLMHKAVGWMLREVGNRNRHTLEEFLVPRYASMPRTMLRYATEKLPENIRQDYLRGRK